MKGKYWFLLAWVILFFGFGLWLYLNYHQKSPLAFAPVANKKIFIFGDESMDAVIPSLRDKFEFEIHPIIINSATTYDLLEQAEELLLPQNPRAVIVVVGKYDGIHNIPSDTSTYNFAQLVKLLQEHGVFVTYLNWSLNQSGWNLALFRKQNEDMGVLHIECASDDCIQEIEKYLLPQFY